MAFPSQYEFKDIVLEVRESIGIIKFDRPNSLNAVTSNMKTEVLNALNFLNEHQYTVFTVITGEGRFFSSGVDVSCKRLIHDAFLKFPSFSSAHEFTKMPAQTNRHEPTYTSLSAKKTAFAAKFSETVELHRSLIDHRKVLVVALNGPAIGAGAAWFCGLADIILASSTTYIQMPFSKLALVPEFGSISHFSETIGVRRANEALILGRKISVEELAAWGFVNRVFDASGFHSAVNEYLGEQSSANDGESMLEAKRLQTSRLRDQRLLALHDAADALSKRFVIGAPLKRFKDLQRELKSRSPPKSKI